MLTNLLNRYLKSLKIFLWKKDAFDCAGLESQRSQKRLFSTTSDSDNVGSDKNSKLNQLI